MRRWLSSQWQQNTMMTNPSPGSGWALVVFLGAGLHLDTTRAATDFGGNAGALASTKTAPPVDNTALQSVAADRAR